MSQLQVTGEAKIRDIQGPVVANSGVVTALNGAASQYVRGDGTLADFPTSTGGGSSVSYYLNSSVSQGTIGGVAYRQLGKTPISGAGTDITISANGYIASYITDANDPSLLEVPAGNFNCEFYFSVNSNAHNPYVYAELYKYNGTTFTLLGSNQAIPEYLTNGTTLSAYYFAIPVAVAALSVTDRLAIRIYVNVDGRTVTLHTENGHLCQVVTTFSKGLISLNNLTRQNQFFATGTSGTDFGISSSVATHTFNLPVASASNTGKLSNTDWSTFNNKQAALSFTAPLVNTSNTISIPAATSLVDGYLDNLDWVNFNTAYNNMIISAAVTGTTTKTLTLTQQDAGTITASWTDDNTDAVTSVFGRTGAVIAVSGDYTTTQVTEGTNLYFTNARSRSALSFAAGSGAYNSTTGVITIPTNNNQITNGSNFITLGSLSAGTGISYNNTTGVITNSAPDQTVSLANGAGISVSGTYPSFTIASTITQYTDALARAAISGGTGISYNSTSGIITNTITQYTDALARAAISLTTTGTSGAATYNSTTGVLNIPNYVGGITSVNGTAPISVSTVSGAATVSISTATTTTTGALTSTDWNTFNNKASTADLANYLPLSAGITKPLTGALYLTGSSQNFIIGSQATGFDLSSSGNFAPHYITNFTIYQGAIGAGATRMAMTSTGATTFVSSVTANAGFIANGYTLGASGQNLEMGYASASNIYIINAINRTSGLYDKPLYFDSQVLVLNNGSTGNVLIGTTTNAGFKLDVNGTGRFTGALSGTSATFSGNLGYTSGSALYPRTTSVNNWYLNKHNAAIDRIDNAVGNNNAFTIGIDSLGTYTPNIFFYSGGAATFSSSVTATNALLNTTESVAKLDVVSSIAKTNTAFTRIASFRSSESLAGEPLELYIAQLGNATSSSQAISLQTGHYGLDFAANLAINGDGGNVMIGTKTGVSGGGKLQVNGNVNINGVFQINGTTIGGGGGSGVTGSGTTNFIPKWTGTTSLGNSNMADDGSVVSSAVRFSFAGDTRYGVARVYNSAAGDMFGMEQVSAIQSGGGGAATRIFTAAGSGNYISLGWYTNATTFVDALRINYSTGNVLINTTTDLGGGYKLQVNGSIAMTYANFFNFKGSSGAGDVIIDNSGSTLRVTGNFLVNGTVTSSGGFFDTSDSRLKIVIKDYNKAKGIENVEARLYLKNNKKELGYFAQELEEILPSAVGKDTDGYLTLSYSQVHTAKIAYLEEKVAQLEELIKSLL